MKPKTPKPALAGQKKLTLRDACHAHRCRNAAGPKGLCLTCLDALPRKQRLRLSGGGLLRWARIRVAIRIIHCRQKMRGRN